MIINHQVTTPAPEPSENDPSVPVNKYGLTEAEEAQITLEREDQEAFGNPYEDLEADFDTMTGMPKDVDNDPGVLAQIEADPLATLDPTMGGLFAFYENESAHLKALADYETNVAGPERRAQERKELQALTQDPQWIEATKHLDAVAAFVAQGTHNPRAYARAQSRFVGSILKLTQNHMEDTISKAVEDRFALLSHDGIEDTRVLSNRFEDIRVAVNEVFQYPDLNDVVGRDMVGL